MQVPEPSDHIFENNLLSALLSDFDADPEIQQMIKDSEQAIEKGQVYSTKQVIEMIKNGDI